MTTTRDLTVELCKEVGSSPPSGKEPTKWAYNSVLAYLTGEFAIEPQDLYATDSPNKWEIKEEIAQELDLDDYLEWVSDHGADRPFRKAEKSEILQKLRDSEDIRPDTNGRVPSTLGERGQKR